MHPAQHAIHIRLAFFGLLVGVGGVFSWFPGSYLGIGGLLLAALIALSSAVALLLLLTPLPTLPAPPRPQGGQSGDAGPWDAR